MRARLPAALALAGLLAGCTLTNRATVYPPISGPIDIRWKLSTEGVQSVDFLLDGQPVGSDSDPAEGFAITLDSSRYSDGLHRLTVIANKQGGATQTIEHTVLFQNP